MRQKDGEERNKGEIEMRERVVGEEEYQGEIKKGTKVKGEIQSWSPGVTF